MPTELHFLTDDVTWFPKPELALNEPGGLLALGGDLSVERLVNAYQRGIFPWYSEGEPLLWWSPDPRAVIPNCQVRINKSLKKFLKKCDYQVSINTCFDDVIKNCALPRVDDGTWIFPEMISAYQSLHRAGHAHSIEVWTNVSGVKTLVGGLYGVLVGSCFCGESMFSLKPNASKVALTSLAEILDSLEHAFIDCQIANPYLMSMGATTMSRTMFLDNLAAAAKVQVPDSLFKPRFISPSCLEKN